MGWWLAKPEDAQIHGWIKRFDPTMWTVNFPRPMMAAATTLAPDALRVDAHFYKANDLAGLIWEAADRFDHPLLQYETSRDFRGCTLRFHWKSEGLMPLDAINGPTLTIEGRDAGGTPRAWYVRLWNYANGLPEDTDIQLDFADLDGGFLLPGEADPVWAGDVDRMFISLVPPGYTAVDAPLPAPAAAWVELSGVTCDGPGSVLAIGEAMLPAHSLRIATGYDDAYNLTPARVLRNALLLGYRGVINHYVGMSHYFSLAWNASASGFLIDGDELNAPCAKWHADFILRAKRLGYDIILSLSYELLDMHCPPGWKQCAGNGDPALTGWVPPSTLLSPANDDAMAWLRTIARAFAAIARDAGVAVRFQVGEPWWWVMGDGRICLYDEAAVAAFGGAPAAIGNVRGTLSAAQKALLDAAGVVLAQSTADLADAVREVAADAELLLLAYMPSVLDPAAPEVRRANLPTGWASPAFDRLQLEDYDWVTSGDLGATARGIAAATARLGYPIDEQHYFSGFVLNAADASDWALIDAAAQASRQRGTAETFVWALPQVTRDGFVHFELGEDEVDAFDEVDFPIALGREASVSPSFSTAIVTTASGAEQRNADWADARLRYDVGPGMRSEADIATLISFFRARHGAARGFRLRDPFDDSSNGMIAPPGFADQVLGSGDGTRTAFALVKHYGGQQRRITRPASASVRIGVGGSERLSGWSLSAGGVVTFDAAPGAGLAVTAGYRFDVPVRFAEDRLEVNRASFLAGEAPSVPLIELREG